MLFLIVMQYVNSHLYFLLLSQEKISVCWSAYSPFNFLCNKQSMSNEYSKTCVNMPLKNRQNKDLNETFKLNEGKKYSAILLTCIN